jgi:hypothetical protein
MHKTLRGTTLVAFGIAFGVAGCASSHPLPANYVPAQTAISAADAVGAEREPQGALHLKMARDQVATAKSLAHEGEDERAALMLDRARVDAEMALMITREASAAHDASQAERRVQQLSPR